MQVSRSPTSASEQVTYHRPCGRQNPRTGSDFKLQLESHAKLNLKVELALPKSVMGERDKLSTGSAGALRTLQQAARSFRIHRFEITQRRFSTCSNN